MKRLYTLLVSATPVLQFFLWRGAVCLGRRCDACPILVGGERQEGIEHPGGMRHEN